tara:strand:+ start:1095 stop:1367 length:273 start_codon:yes stop_codon:yes gene_type:complete
MPYPKQVALLIHHSANDRQIKRITFQTEEQHLQFIKDMPTTQQLIEGDEEVIERALDFDATPDEDKSIMQLFEEMNQINDEFLSNLPKSK